MWISSVNEFVMKKIFTIVFVLLVVVFANAQQRPHYTQYILNNYIVNPAISGIENYTDVKMSVRDQWVGLNGAPRTAYFTIQAPLGKKDYRPSATGYSVPGENPRGRSYWENYTAAEPHHGIGMAIINDRTGSYNRFSATVSYAYHIGLNATTNLAGGFAAGITRVGIDKSKTDFGGGDPTDPAAGNSATGYINKIRPDISAGLWLYSRDYFVGLAAQQIVPQKLTFVDDALAQTTGRLIPHIFLTTGYRFLVNEDINAIPSLMLKYIHGSSKNDFQPELNLKLQFRDMVWIGGSWRYEDGYAAMIGAALGNFVNVGYAYDFTTTELNTVSNGTHEFLIGFILGNKYSEACPRCNW
jgi:type IX secretion system PorP/SprF family membrane protein